MILFIKYRSDGLDQDPDKHEAFVEKKLEKNEDYDDDEVYQEYICREYLIYQKLTKYYYFFMVTFILIFNVCLYMLTEPLI